MKFLFLLFFTLGSFNLYADQTSVALRRSNGLLRFIAEQESLRDFALSTVVGTRCGRYLPETEGHTCKETVKKMIQILDYDVIFKNKIIPENSQRPWAPSSFLFVAFKQKLITLLSDEKTKTYLYDLNQKLYEYLLNDKEEFNVWELSKKHFDNDYSAAMAIAVLFQDTSTLKLHLGYLDHTRPTGTEMYESNKELLSRVIDTINLILDTSEENYRKLFYPDEIQNDLNRNIYHFYVPLFLAKALERDKVSKNDAFTATLMLTLSYEFITSSGNYKYILKDPEKIENTHTVRDIFGGYCGSMIGIKGLHFDRSFRELESSFATSTVSGVELLLSH